MVLPYTVEKQYKTEAVTVTFILFQYFFVLIIPMNVFNFRLKDICSPSYRTGTHLRILLSVSTFSFFGVYKRGIKKGRKSWVKFCLVNIWYYDFNCNGFTG